MPTTDIKKLTERIMDVKRGRHAVDESIRLWIRDCWHRGRWQMVSDDSVWMFPADLKLSTVEMAPGWLDDFGYQYESCLFTHHDSRVLDQYRTLEEAIEGHKKLAIQYKLKEKNYASGVSSK